MTKLSANQKEYENNKNNSADAFCDGIISFRCRLCFGTG
jgi:hypothetical protein